MEKQEIAEGLRHAMERGYSLDIAISSFINAGYNRQDVLDSAKTISGSVLVPEIKPTMPMQQMPQMPQMQQQTKPTQPMQQMPPIPQAPPQSQQSQQILPPTEKKKNTIWIIIVILFIIALIGSLITLFFI